MFKNTVNAARKLFRSSEVSDEATQAAPRDVKGAVIRGAAAAGAAVGAMSANAAGVDFSTLTGAVDFSTLIAAVLAIGGNILIVYVAFKGAKVLISSVKGL